MSHNFFVMFFLLFNFFYRCLLLSVFLMNKDVYLSRQQNASYIVHVHTKQSINTYPRVLLKNGLKDNLCPISNRHVSPYRSFGVEGEVANLLPTCCGLVSDTANYLDMSR